MRIHELEVDRFGVWREVTFPFHERGVTVLYGPNEAGKSTLMRFVRGVLYGFQPGDEVEAGRRSDWLACSGALKVSHQGKTYRIHRHSEKGTRGRLEINGQVIPQQSPLLQEIVGGASEALFRDVFAIGLTELQQLATLSGDEIASRIYGLSLGREGEQIVRAQQAFARTEQHLIDPEHRKGEIFSLTQQLAELDRELERVGQPAQRHSRLNDQIIKHDATVEELKRRQRNLQHDSRGYDFLGRVWEPWHKHRHLDQKLKQLPVTKLDIELLKGFDDLELQLSEVDEERKQLIDQARKLQKQVETIQLRPELEAESCAIKFLFEESRAMETLQQRLEQQPHAHPQRTQSDSRLQTDQALEQQVQGLLTGFDGRWDARRVRETSLNPERMHELLSLAETYRQANRTRTRTAKRYKRLNGRLKALEQNEREQQRDQGSQPVDQVRRDLTQRVRELEELRGLNLRKQHLRKTLELLPKVQTAEAVQQELPPFFYNVLWFFAIAGAILFLAGTYGAARGLVIGGSHAAVIGGCYLFLGLASLGTCWTLKQFFSQQKFEVTGITGDRSRLESELSRVETQILKLRSRNLLRPQRVAPRSESLPPTRDSDDELLIDESLNELREQLANLRENRSSAEKIEGLRRRLSRLRGSLQDRQKRVSTSRREWTEALRKLGLTHTLKVSAVIGQLERLAEAQQLVSHWERSHNSVAAERQKLDDFLTRFERLARQLDGPQASVRDPWRRIAEWHRELQLLEERRRERAQLRATAKEKRAQAAKLVERIERMREQRGLLLAQMGVADRGDIAVKLAAIDEQKTLEHQVRQAQQALDEVLADQPELVITEEMLQQYEVNENRAHQQQIRNELQSIDEELQREYQTLGKLRQELHDIENDRKVASLRFDREQIADALRAASESLFAHRLIDRVVDQMRSQIERDRQPQTLQLATRYLRQLTCGRYHNIWAPLGEKTLFVDDEAGLSLRVEHLSSGTREQVFLALRLAMIREFAAQGMDLPMILDDVTVNFDQLRTEAAVETLLSVAEEGQQIMLFTCHQHVAQLFEAEGVEPIWLPAHRSELAV